MIIDREGDVVVLDTALLKIDLGGFLVAPTWKEICARAEQCKAMANRLLDRYHRECPAKPRMVYAGVRETEHGKSLACLDASLLTPSPKSTSSSPMP